MIAIVEGIPIQLCKNHPFMYGMTSRRQVYTIVSELFVFLFWLPVASSALFLQGLPVSREVEQSLLCRQFLHNGDVLLWTGVEN